MKKSPNCEIERGGKSEDCVIGCVGNSCCEMSHAGSMAHRCLMQLLKRLGQDLKPDNKCGYCGLTGKEQSGRSLGTDSRV